MQGWGVPKLGTAFAATARRAPQRRGGVCHYWGC